MTTNHQRKAAEILVAGAGLTGLTAALLLARAGHRVLLLDSDQAAPPGAPSRVATGWNRANVPQLHQPHISFRDGTRTCAPSCPTCSMG